MEGPNILIPLLLPFFLYAEIHYRFRYFFSYLKKNEPEILADIPHRIEPNQPLKILILIKDAHLYPISLEQIKVDIFTDKKLLLTKNFLDAPFDIKKKWWWQVIEIQLQPEIVGTVYCNVYFTINCNGKRFTYCNDNYKTSSKKPFKVYISTYKLNKLNYLYLGEFHSHSNYTEDQVEFGIPVEPAVVLASAMGLNFISITDHSYDLDDTPDNYLINDPSLQKWYSIKSEVERYSNSQITILLGEEISCRNSEDKNVHFLLINNKRFFEGSGDSAEKWLRTYSEYSIRDILNQKEPEALAIAAHPFEKVGFLERLLLGRGQWLDVDFKSDKLNGIQFINGVINDGFRIGYKFWIKQLLQGNKLTLFAGNDAHGNFNRYRQIGIPFISIREREEQLFGYMRTGIIAEENTKYALITSAKEGRVIVTDGPVGMILDAKNDEPLIGKTLKLRTVYMLRIFVQTTPEYGDLMSVTIYRGRIGCEKEEVFFKTFPELLYNFEKEIEVNFEEPFYLRLEVWTKNAEIDKGSHFCITNPVWFL